MTVHDSEIEWQDAEIEELKAKMRAHREQYGEPAPSGGSGPLQHAKRLIENAQNTLRIVGNATPGSTMRRVMMRSAERDLERAKAIRDGGPEPSTPAERESGMLKA